MAVRCETCGLVAYSTPDRCPRSGGESFRREEASPRRPAPSGNESLVAFVLFLVAPLVAIAALCAGMIVLLMRPPAS